MVYDDINVVTLSANENLWSTINESEHKTCVYHVPPRFLIGGGGGGGNGMFVPPHF